MTTNHIDQLTEWWENAEEGDARPGDTIITPGSTHYLIETAPDYPLDRANQPYRILARAPKPKPAWHDAPAVIATYRDERGMVSGAWVREGKPGYWEGPEGDVVASEALEDVVPLIEAKVTDEMVERLERHFIETSNAALPAGLARRMLTAALGLEAT